jgi:hypothetical protein
MVAWWFNFAADGTSKVAFLFLQLTRLRPDWSRSLIELRCDRWGDGSSACCMHGDSGEVGARSGYFQVLVCSRSSAVRGESSIMDDGVLTSDWTAGLDGWRAYAVAEMVILQTGREREVHPPACSGMCRHRGWKYNLYMHESGVKGTEKLTLMSLYEPWRGSRSPKDLSVGRLSTSLTIEAFIIDILLLSIVTADVHRM